MSLHNIARALLITYLSLYFLSALPVQARGNDLTVIDGQGEELQVKNPLFGKKVRLVKDRLGDGFAQEKGILGGSDSQLSIFGNSVHHHKGLLGNSELSGSTILGDRFVSKKGIFGRRKMAVDLSGTGGLLKGLFGHTKPMQTLPTPPFMPQSLPSPLVPNTSQPAGDLGAVRK